MVAKLHEARRVYGTIVDNPAVAQHPRRALLRALRWQLAKRTGAKRALVHVDGLSLYCYPDSTGGSSVLYTGLYDFDEMSFVLRYMRPGERFVDVGANIGAYSAFVATFVPGAQITAVEPDSTSRKRLLENFELNAIVGATVSEKVLGDHEGEITFSSGRDTLNSIVDPSAPDSVTLPMTTLDALVPDSPALLKIDVEGAELQVLSGAERILTGENPPALVMELNGLCERFDITPKLTRNFLARFGYEMFEFDGTQSRLTSFTGDGYPAGKNIIALHAGSDAEARLANSPLGVDLNALKITVDVERG